MKKLSPSILAASLAMVFATHAHATVVSTTTPTDTNCTGTVAVSNSAPSSITSAQGNNNGGCTLYVFNEDQSTALSSHLIHSAFGTGSSGVATTNGQTLSSGSVVSSHMIAFQPNSGNETVSASVTFNQAIVAVIYGNTAFSLTHALGLNSLGSYGNYSNNFGLEYANNNAASDLFSVAGNTISFTFRPSSNNNNNDDDDERYVYGDHLRVLTGNVPAPASIALLGLGAIGLIASRRRPVSKKSV